MNAVAEALKRKLRHRSAVIAVVGLGYVGLPLALSALRAGYAVVGVDIDQNKVDSLNRGESYLRHIDISELGPSVASHGFAVTTDFARLNEADAIIICVPTPLGLHREPDLSFVAQTVSSIVPHLRKGQLVSLESSTYPGTTEEFVAAPITEAGFHVGMDVFVAYSPEREDPGNPKYTTRTIPKVVGGFSDNCLVVAMAMYEGLVDAVVPVSSIRVAEMTKLLENIYRAVNIGLVNEMKMVADRMDIDIWEVIKAAATKPFGFTPFYPGPGLGGHCIPIDPYYLTWKAREVGVNTRFIELAGEINTAMPEWVVAKTAAALNDHGIALKNARILVLGVSYKKNIDDMRESPAVEIIVKLMERGARVDYCDPHVSAIPPMRRHELDLRSIEITNDMGAQYDCVLIATDHDAFDYDRILESSQLIVDTRGRLKDKDGKVVRA